MVVAIGIMATITPSAHAVGTDLQLEIDGIECDLEALYGDSDPSTVIIPTYCNNAPQPPDTTTPVDEGLPEMPMILEPQPNMPVVPSYDSLLLGSLVESPTIDPTKTIGAIGGIVAPLLPNPDKEVVPLHEAENTPTSFVEVTVVVAVLVSTAVAGSIVASGVFGTPALEVVSRVKSFFMRLFK